MAPVARGCLAFGPQVLGMTGGHQFGPCPQPVLGGHL
uniref:Transcriptional adaptor 3 n=1 Tax=Pan troglodytes TaxID=9598 RepID=K7DS56_PANTR